MPERERRPRQRSIRALLSLGLAVPLICLLALWGFGTDVTMTRTAATHDFTVADQLYSGPAQALSSALAAEQLQTVTWLSAGRVGPVAPLRAQFGATDRAAASFVAAARADERVISSSAQPALHSLESLLTGRANLRTGVLTGRLPALAAVEAYGAILTAVNAFDASLLVTDNASLSRQAAATAAADGGVDLARSDVALVSVAVAAGDVMSAPERELFGQDAAQAQLMMNGAVSVLTPTLGSGYLRTSRSGAFRALLTDEGQIASRVTTAGPLPVRPPAFAATAAALNQDYQAAEQQDVTGLTSLAARASGAATLATRLVAGLGLVAVLASIGLAILLWWRIVRDVTRLQEAALPLAGDHLPQPVERQSDADAGRGSARRVRWPTGSIREIANAGAVLSAAQLLARQATATQDQLRSGASQFLRNLGLRSHALANRQLTLLGALERRSSDPQALASLAVMGQLSRRLRRQADGLLVLSGGSLARSDQAPLPVGDLIRAAMPESDDGSRITVVSDSRDAVTADAVAEVMHLIAELADNAVRHTPQLAEITVRAGRVGRGLVVEVEDDGSGFDLESANSLLAHPPDIGLAVGDGLGLLVVARIAARHGVTVHLRSAPTGGTTAIVLLPHAILVASEVRDTIVDGSLPRIDVTMPSPTTAPQSYLAPTLPQRAADPDAAQPMRPGAPDLSPQPAATAPVARIAESNAPWYWLTASQPARTSAPEPPGSAADNPRRHASDPGAAAPLPRRIRPTVPPFGRTVSATPPSPGADQAAAHAPADRDSDDSTEANPGAQSAGDS
jgi:signal transduction histidine kinase